MLLAVAVTAGLLIRYPGVLVSGVLNTGPRDHVDFETFWRSTVALLHGADVYHTGSVLPNLNPPFLSLLLAPFGLIPLLQSYWTFTALSVVLVTAAVLATGRELRSGTGVTVFGVLTLWACSPLHGTLLLGQIYGLLLAGVTAAWLAQRRGRAKLSAVLVALVVALKPSLAPLLLVPLTRSNGPARWPALWTGMAAAAGFTFAGVLAAGTSSAVEWLRLATGTPAPEVDANASLPGLLARLGGPGALGWVITVVVVVLSLWWVRDRSRSTECPPRGTVVPADATLFAVGAGCLLASPISWLNYTIMLWPGALILLRAGRWRIGVPLVTLSIIPVAWGNLWQEAPHAPVSLLGRSFYCAILLGFWCALLRYARSGESTTGSAIASNSVTDSASGSATATESVSSTTSG